MKTCKHGHAYHDMERECPTCRNAARAEYRARPDIQMLDTERRRRYRLAYTEQKRVLLAEFQSRGCSVCPENEPCVIDAHHVEGKKFNIASALTQGYSPTDFKRELDKCVPLCSNCHRKLHAGILVLNTVL